MIDAKELRIKNKDLKNGVFVCDVLSLRRNEIEISFEKEIYALEYKNVHPIALTEEILLRCGAGNLINSATGRTSFDIGSLMFENEEGGFCVFGSEWTIGKPFYYLHQLQNLYFALTGEELNIQL